MSATRHGAASEPFAVARLSRGPALRSTTFTNEEILGAIRRRADSYGEPPTTVDWDPSRARRLDQAWRAARFEEGLWPTAALARGRFKQFNAVVERAGLAPHWRIARYRDGDWPSARSVAHHFGSFTNGVVQAGLVHRDRGVHHVDRRSQRAANRVRVAHAIAEARRPGVDDLVERLRGLAAARRAEDPVSKRAALLDRAASALAGAQICGTEA